MVAYILMIGFRLFIIAGSLTAVKECYAGKWN